ncbi:MAG: LPS export ABC transporter permease LptF [Steroidobacteraceae bacterium]
MRIIERYIFREVMSNWIGVTLVLLVILLSNSLASALQRAAEGGFGGKVVLTLLWLTSLQQLVVLIPVGLFLAIMLALGRLYHESELTAMQACGLGNRRLLKPVLWLALLAAALLCWLSLQQAPQSAQSALDLRSEAVRQARFSSLQPGKFATFNGSSGIVFYAESVDAQGVLHNIYAERAQGDRLEIWVAKRAIQLGIGEQQQTFVLYEGQRYEGTPGSSEFRIIDFVEGAIPVSLPEVAATGTQLDMRDTVSLLGSDDLQVKAELQRRLAGPLMVLVLAMLAVPLAHLRPRQGRYAKVGYFILAYLFYSGLIVIAGNAMTRGQSPAWLGMWWVHGLGLMVTVLLWHYTGSRTIFAWRKARA